MGIDTRTSGGSERWYTFTDHADIDLDDGDWCHIIWMKIIREHNSSPLHVLGTNDHDTSGATTGSFSFKYNLTSNFPQFACQDDADVAFGGTSGHTLTGTADINDGEWHLVAAQRSGGNAEFWHAAVGNDADREVQEALGSGFAAVTATQNLYFGKTNGGFSSRYYGNGLADYAKIDRALTQDEFNAIAHGVPITEVITDGTLIINFDFKEHVSPQVDIIGGHTASQNSSGMITIDHPPRVFPAAVSTVTASTGSAQNIAANGIGVTVGFGTASISQAVQLAATGIAVLTNVGSATLSPGLASIVPTGIPVSIGFGGATIRAVAPMEIDAFDAIAIELELFDDSLAATLSGPPFPFGTKAFGDFSDLSVQGGIRTEYWSDVGFTTDNTDLPAHTYFAPRLTSSYNARVNLFSGAEPGGGGIPAYGDIRAANNDLALDDIIRLNWDFRNVRMWSGRTDQQFKNFTKVFQGRTDGVSVDLTGLNIRLRGPFTAIDRTLQTSFYTGAGGLEGGADNKGHPKPKGWGENKNASPVLLDAVKNLYQIHDGQIQSVDKVRDEGDPLSDAGSAADFTALDAWTPVAGQYKACLSCGVFRVGDKPQGKLTIDFKGDASGTYVNSTSDVIERIVTSHLGADNLASSEIDNASFTAIEAANSAPIQYYTGSNPVTAREVIDKLATAVGAIWYFSRTGALTVKRVEPPSGPTVTITEANISSRGGGLKRVTPEQPTYEHRIRWGVNHTPMSENEIAPAVASADREFLNVGERYAISDNIGDTSEASVRSKFRKARALQIESFFVAESDARTEADRRQEIWGLPRHRYTVPVTDGLFAYWVGDVVSLDIDRFGLSGGKNLLVVSVTENAKQNQSTVELWG